MNKIDYKPGNLRGKNVKIIGQKNKNDPSPEADTIFPKIFIQGSEMFHSKKFAAKVNDVSLKFGLK